MFVSVLVFVRLCRCELFNFCDVEVSVNLALCLCYCKYPFMGTLRAHPKVAVTAHLKERWHSSTKRAGTIHELSEFIQKVAVTAHLKERWHSSTKTAGTIGNCQSSS